MPTGVTLDASQPDAVQRTVELTGDELVAHEALLAELAAREAEGAKLTAEDAERLRVVEERASDDPAFGALAGLVLRGRAR